MLRLLVYHSLHGAGCLFICLDALLVLLRHQLLQTGPQFPARTLHYHTYKSLPHVPDTARVEDVVGDKGAGGVA